MLLHPGDKVDRYQVESILGQGGMAVVYKVRHLELRTPHAMKILTLRSPGLADRMLQEGRIQATVRHPNIVAVTDAVRVDGQPALVMEYIDGPTLEGLLQKFQPSLAQIDDLAQGILAGVAFAHGKGLVHRDLKPGNVLVTVEGGKVIAKVTDFGLAKVLSDDLERIPSATRTGVTMGTPSFMAPEQFKNARHADGRADIFSLGAVFYEMVTGAPAFPAGNLIDLYHAMESEEYRHIRAWRQGVPDRMVSAIEGALRAEPSNRWSDCMKLLEAWRGENHEEGQARSVYAPLSPEPWEPHHIELVQSITKVPPTQLSPGIETTPLPPPPQGGRNPTLTPGTRQLIAANMAPSLLAAVAPKSVPTTLVVSRRPAMLAGLAFVGVGLSGALAGIALLVAWQLGLGTGADPVRVDSTLVVEGAGPAPVVPEPAVVVPEPVVAVADPEPEPLQASVTPPPVRPRPAPAPVPAVVTAPAPSGRTPGTALVNVSGVERAYLVDPAGARSPVGEIDPGTYSLLVFFDPADPTTVLRDLVLSADQTRDFQCYPGLRMCK